MTGIELAKETYQLLLNGEPNEEMATTVAAQIADLSGEETWRFISHFVGRVNAPELPHEDSGVKLDDKVRRLKMLNSLLNKLPAFQSAMKRMHETPRPGDVGGRNTE